MEGVTKLRIGRRSGGLNIALTVCSCVSVYVFPPKLYLARGIASANGVSAQHLTKRARVCGVQDERSDQHVFGTTRHNGDQRAGEMAFSFGSSVRVVSLRHYQISGNCAMVISHLVRASVRGC